MDKIFTHTDLDGIGCAVLAKLANAEIIIEYCDYDNINEKVSQFINHNTLVGDLFIADISISDEVAQRIDAVPSDLILLDHHPTALYLNKYKWCTVKIEDDDTGLKTCGTELFYHWLVEYGYIQKSRVLNRFVEVIKNYDTWHWVELGEKGIISKQINDLFDIYGQDRFLSWCIERIKARTFPTLEYTENFLIQQRQEKINRYIENKNQQLIIHSFKNWTSGYVFANQFVSELGNRLCKMHSEIDFVTIIDVENCTVSYRTIKDDIDLGKDVAALFGGGGHPKAAGSQFDKAVQLQIIQKLFGE